VAEKQARQANGRYLQMDAAETEYRNMMLGLHVQRQQASQLNERRSLGEKSLCEGTSGRRAHLGKRPSRPHHLLRALHLLVPMQPAGQLGCCKFKVTHSAGFRDGASGRCVEQ
jgi:hypothetical protein